MRQSETLAADSLIADLAGDLESITSSLGIIRLSFRARHALQNSAAVFRHAASAPLGSLRSRKRHSCRWSRWIAERSAGRSVRRIPLRARRINKEDEDLETHYNLGIAYREMGLLEEAISEFQKVASSADKGPAFRYAMQCSTLLGLAFMEKGQPAIAAIWYERALKTPGLDQESILALRYDLGVAQELAGDTHAALQQFFAGLRNEHRLP